MAAELATPNAQYRLLHFQPVPEDGDRVCVALLLEEPGRKCSLLVDRSFPKLRCIAPQVDADGIGFYLSDMEEALRRSRESVESVLRQYTPQVVASPPREIVAPLSEDLKAHLVRRFLGRMGRQEVKSLTLAEVSRHQRYAHLRTLIGQALPNAQQLRLQIIDDTSPENVFGRPVRHVRPVPVVVKGARSILLVDGLDLNELTPARAIKASDEIARNFWHYGLFRDHDLVAQQTPFMRIGIVVNGLSRKSFAAADAHDYALHRFRSDADMVYDVSENESVEKLRAAVLQAATD